jgi:hypothetical protein
MFIVATLIGVLVIALLSGADLFVSEFSVDELSSMGIERKA